MAYFSAVSPSSSQTTGDNGEKRIGRAPGEVQAAADGWATRPGAGEKHDLSPLERVARAVLGKGEEEGPHSYGEF